MPAAAPSTRRYSPCSVAQLLDTGYHYWALGHIHRRQSLGHGKVANEYSGNLQGRSSKPSELGEKGALVVKINGHRVHEVRFATCDRVRFAGSRRASPAWAI